MYEKHIHQMPINRDSLSQVLQAVIAYEERMAFVESVESRFGPGTHLGLSNRPELEPAVFCRSLPGEMLPWWYTPPPLGRGRDRTLGAASERAKQMECLASRRNTGILTSNLGRGSPCLVRTACVSGRPGA